MDAAQAQFKQAPQGFFLAHETLNSYSNQRFTQLLLDVLHAQAQTSAPSASQLLNGSDSTSDESTISPQQHASCVECLSFILRALTQHQLSAADAATLLQKESELSDEKRQTLINIWSQFQKSVGSDALSAVSRSLSLGRLIDFNWNIGIAVRSSNSASAASSLSSSQPPATAPFVTLAFQIESNGSGNETEAAKLDSTQTKSTRPSTRTHIVECTYLEFLQVRKQFQDIFGQLDAI